MTENREQMLDLDSLDEVSGGSIDYEAYTLNDMKKAKEKGMTFDQWVLTKNWNSDFPLSQIVYFAQLWAKA